MVSSSISRQSARSRGFDAQTTQPAGDTLIGSRWLCRQGSTRVHGVSSASGERFQPPAAIDTSTRPVGLMDNAVVAVESDLV